MTGATGSTFARPWDNEVVRRHLFTFASAVSLLLCATTLALWVRSYWVDDAQIGYLICTPRNYWDVGAFSTNGHFLLELMRIRIPEEVKRDGTLSRFHFRDWSWFDFLFFMEVMDEEGHLGSRFGYAGGAEHGIAGGSSVRVFAVVCPNWVAAGASATAPVLWLCRYLRRQKELRPNRCPNCSYDLTGNTSGVCPECGTRTVVPDKGPQG